MTQRKTSYFSKLTMCPELKMAFHLLYVFAQITVLSQVTFCDSSLAKQPPQIALIGPLRVLRESPIFIYMCNNAVFFSLFSEGMLSISRKSIKCHSQLCLSASATHISIRFNSFSFRVEFQVREGKTRERVSLSVLATSTPEAKITVRTYQNKTHTVDSSAEAELSPSEAIVIRVKAYANGVARVILNSLPSCNAIFK